MSPFKARKISYIIIALAIISQFIGILCGKIMLGLICMIAMLGVMIILLLKYWKCPHCKRYFPLYMSLDSKYCPVCGKQIQ